MDGCLSEIKKCVKPMSSRLNREFSLNLWLRSVLCSCKIFNCRSPVFGSVTIESSYLHYSVTANKK